MYKSQPIPMIDQGKQISAIRLATCCVYKTAGLHTSLGTGTAKALSIKIHGIDKTGSSSVIAECPLEANAGYAAGDYLAQISTSIKVKDYPYICWSYDASQATDFVRLTSAPTMIVEIKEIQDILDSNVATPSL